jgi:uncharacterized protein DUF4440
MKKVLGVIGAILLGLVVASGQQRTPKSDDGMEKVLLDNERALYDAVAKRDKAAFEALVLPEGIWASPTGFIPVRMLADTLDVYRLPSFGGQPFHVVWTDSNKDSALVWYGRTGGGSFGHQSLAETVLVSTVWRKRNGKWVAVHHQESDVVKQ